MALLLGGEDADAVEEVGLDHRADQDVIGVARLVGGPGTRAPVGEQAQGGNRGVRLGLLPPG
jgi:hypothetical protein